ncbi:unnamed protein product [Brachionus calyciflorus]|uniref:Uncharacterized protein n=1 Tax=Brachionus calyciflorus TaxID=104777 RepID=A0A813WWQ0_9BILA|nr:unnamed protein product [Brachionus calyciflorus]
MSDAFLSDFVDSQEIDKPIELFTNGKFNILQSSDSSSNENNTPSKLVVVTSQEEDKTLVDDSNKENEHEPTPITSTGKKINLLETNSSISVITNTNTKRSKQAITSSDSSNSIDRIIIKKKQKILEDNVISTHDNKDEPSDDNDTGDDMSDENITTEHNNMPDKNVKNVEDQIEKVILAENTTVLDSKLTPVTNTQVSDDKIVKEKEIILSTDIIQPTTSKESDNKIHLEDDSDVLDYIKSLPKDNMFKLIFKDNQIINLIKGYKQFKSKNKIILKTTSSKHQEAVESIPNVKFVDAHNFNNETNDGKNLVKVNNPIVLPKNNENRVKLKNISVTIPILKTGCLYSYIANCYTPTNFDKYPVEITPLVQIPLKFKLYHPRHLPGDEDAYENDCQFSWIDYILKVSAKSWLFKYLYFSFFKSEGYYRSKSNVNYFIDGLSMKCMEPGCKVDLMLNLNYKTCLVQILGKSLETVHNHDELCSTLIRAARTAENSIKSTSIIKNMSTNRADSKGKKLTTQLKENYRKVKLVESNLKNSVGIVRQQLEDDLRNLRRERRIENKRIIKEFNSKKVFKVEKLFKYNRQRFWKEISKFKNKSSFKPKNVSLKSFEIFYKDLFSAENTVENFEREKIEKDTTLFYESIKKKVYDYPVTEFEVKSAINNLKSNKAVGHDNIPADMLKHSKSSSLMVVLRKFYTIIFYYGNVPDDFNVSIVTIETLNKYLKVKQPTINRAISDQFLYPRALPMSSKYRH